MGIRVHKMLCYALTDVRFSQDDYAITDKRLNLDVFGTGSLDIDRMEYIKWLEELKKQFNDKHDELDIDFELGILKQMHRDKIGNDNYNDVVRYDMEYGLGNILAVVAMRNVKRCCRYDDVIDYYEENLLADKEGSRDRYVLVDMPIFPECRWWDIRSGEVMRETNQDDDKVREKYFAFEKYLMYHRGQGKKYRRNMRDNVELQEQLIKDVNMLGFNSVKEADKYIQPYVPEEVQRVCLYLNLFKDPITVRQMKPIIYVYWG